MRRKKSLPVPEKEAAEILTHLKKLDSSQKKKVIETIHNIKNEPEEKKTDSPADHHG